MLPLFMMQFIGDRVQPRTPLAAATSGGARYNSSQEGAMCIRNIIPVRLPHGTFLQKMSVKAGLSCESHLNWTEDMANAPSAPREKPPPNPLLVCVRSKPPRTSCPAEAGALPSGQVPTVFVHVGMLLAGMPCLR